MIFIAKINAPNPVHNEQNIALLLSNSFFLRALEAKLIRKLYPESRIYPDVQMGQHDLMIFTGNFQ